MSNENKNNTADPGGRGSGGPGGGPGGGGPGGGGPGGALARPVEKAKDFKGTLFRLVGYLKPQKMKFFAVGILAIVSTAFSIFGPKVLGKASDKTIRGVMAQYSYLYKIQTAVNQGQSASTIENLRNAPVPLFDLEYISKILIMMVILYVLVFVCSYAMSYIMSGVSQTTVYTMRNEVKKTGSAPFEVF